MLDKHARMTVVQPPTVKKHHFNYPTAFRNLFNKRVSKRNSPTITTKQNSQIRGHQKFSDSNRNIGRENLNIHIQIGQTNLGQICLQIRKIVIEIKNRKNIHKSITILL